MLISFAFISAKAQLTNTKWKGTIHLDQPTDIIIHFGTDTLEAFSAEDNSSVEIMHYSIQDTVLTVQKISGQSQCDDVVVGKYKIEIKDNEMLMTVIDDDCDDRGPVLDNTTWKKEP